MAPPGSAAQPPGMPYAILQAGPHGVVPMTVPPYGGQSQQQPGVVTIAGMPVQQQYGIAVLPAPGASVAAPLGQQVVMQMPPPAQALQPQPAAVAAQQPTQQPRQPSQQQQQLAMDAHQQQLQQQAALQAAAILTAAAQIAVGLPPITAAPPDPADLDQVGLGVQIVRPFR